MATSRGTLKVKIVGDEKPLKQSLDRATSDMDKWATGAVGIFAGLGAAGAAFLVHEFGDALERGQLGDRLAASLGATPEEAARYGKIAGDLYVGAWGDSLEQVHDAVDTVVSTLGRDLDDGTIEHLTALALDYAAAFDEDVTESVNAAGVLLRTGLARDAEHAFDLLVSGAQRVPKAMRGELIPIVEEYSQDFAALGITGEEAFGLMIEASQDGRIELDKTGDALKELTIRATDMSTASVAAFEAAGLDADEMAARFLAGGDTARGALDDLVEGLLAIEDPVDRANAAIGLMGTPLEDLSVTEIPDFLQRLADMDTSLGDVAGAATEMSDTLNDNAAVKIESFKRRAGAALDTFLSEHVLPVAEDVMDAFSEDGVGGAVDAAIDAWEAAQPRVEQWFHGTFLPWWSDVAVPWMSWAGGEMGAALVNGFIEIIADGLVREFEEGGMVGRAISRAIAAMPGVDDDFRIGFDLPDFDVPDFVGNPIERPQSPGGRSTSRNSTGGAAFSGAVTAFHDGGYVEQGGLALLARKERVLNPSDTQVLTEIRDLLRSGQSMGGPTVHMKVIGEPSRQQMDEARMFLARVG